MTLPPCLIESNHKIMVKKASPKSELKEFKDEVIRHFDVVVEDLESKIDTVAEGLESKIDLLTEQVANNTEQIEGVKDRLDSVEETIGVIKVDVEFIKYELKKKVSWDEFAVLEKRVAMLEAKKNR